MCRICRLRSQLGPAFCVVDIAALTSEKPVQDVARHAELTFRRLRFTGSRDTSGRSGVVRDQLIGGIFGSSKHRSELMCCD
jgi:hypothetical protein